MKSSEIFHCSFFIFHLVAIAILAYAFGRPEGFSMPQVAQGDDVLSVAFGDAREVISRAAVQKADSYFHGGVDMDCSLHDHEHEGEIHDHERHDHEHCSCGHCHDHHESEPDNSTTPHSSLLTTHFDPWHWLNSHIRAPEIEKHLEGEKAVELMPWFWASVKADPHNAEAWSLAWYIADHAMKDRELAARVLKEAREKNPESVEIAFTEGRAYYAGGKGDLVAAKAAFERAVMLANEKCGGDTSKLSAREEESFRFSCNYLKHIENTLK